MTGLLALLTLALLGLGATPGAAAGLRRVILVACGPGEPGATAALKAGLGEYLGVEVLPAKAMPVPPAAYDPGRRQYLADAFLEPLSRNRQHPRDLVLGVTALDLYVPELNFVFGLADPGRQTAVISWARLTPEFYGRRPDPGLLRERVLKEAVHELGHLLGLPHCPHSGCIMFFSNSLRDTDRKGPGFCPACRRLLEKTN
jgi:archaemetzincin